MARKKSSNLPALPFDSERDNDYIADELPLSADLDTIYHVPNIDMGRVLMFLRHHGACDGGYLVALEAHDARTAWQSIIVPNWLFWIVREVNGRHGFPEYDAFMQTTWGIWHRYSMAMIRAATFVSPRYDWAAEKADQIALFELKSRIVFYD